jgi:hypothetical protein
MLAATIKAATLVAAGQAAASVQVAALVEGVLRAMLLNKLKVIAAVLLAAGLLATATGLRPVPAAAGDGGAQASRPAAQGQAQVSDADFIRRNSLEIRGTLPSAIEVHYFLRDTNADKRAWLLGKLRAEAASADREKVLRAEDRLLGEALAEGQPGGGGTLEARVEQVNPKERVLTVSLGGALAGGLGGSGGGVGVFKNVIRLENLPVAKDARVVVGGREGRLADLKAGMHVSLQLRVQGTVTVQAIRAGGTGRPGASRTQGGVPRD